jgi:hypothetical protein
MFNGPDATPIIFRDRRHSGIRRYFRPLLIMSMLAIHNIQYIQWPTHQHILIMISTALGQTSFAFLLQATSQTNIVTAFPLTLLSIRDSVHRSPISATQLLAGADNNDDVSSFSSSSQQQLQQKQGLVALGSALQSQLISAFSQLDESDQYDAILTGLCAKILDNSSMKGNDVLVALQDPLNLLEEMNARRVVAGSRSIMALVDVCE